MFLQGSVGTGLWGTCICIGCNGTGLWGIRICTGFRQGPEVFFGSRNRVGAAVAAQEIRCSGAMADDGDSLAEAPAPIARPPLGHTWRPVSIEAAFTLGGGYLRPKKHFALESRVSITNNIERTYIRINKNDDWVLKAVAGDKAQRGALRRCKAIELIREKMTEWSPMKKDAVAATKDEDPMSALEAVQEDTAPAPKRRYSRKRPKLQELVVTMPKRCPYAAPECKETKEVSVMADGTNQLWLLKEDVPWLMAYMADENGFGSVAVTADDTAVAEPNCPDVPGLCVEWDWATGDGFTAEFVTGPLAGTQRIACKISNFTKEKYDRLSAIHKYEKIFCDAGPAELKTAVHQHLVSHCSELLRQRSAADASTPAADASTPAGAASSSSAVAASSSPNVAGSGTMD